MLILRHQTGSHRIDVHALRRGAAAAAGGAESAGQEPARPVPHAQRILNVSVDFRQT